MSEPHDLEQQLGRSLHEQAAAVPGSASPTLAGIVGRAHAIRRRRRAARLGGLAGVLVVGALVAPQLLAGTTERSTDPARRVDPAGRVSTEAPAEPVVVTTPLAELPQGPATTVPWIRFDEQVLEGAAGVELPPETAQAVPLGAGWLLIGRGDPVPGAASDRHVYRSTAAGLEDLGEGSAAVVSPGGDRVAWVSTGGYSARLRVASSDGGEPSSAPLDVPYAEVVGFLPDDRVAVTTYPDTVPATTAQLAVAEDGSTTPIGGSLEVAATSPVTGLVAGRVPRTGRTCAGVGEVGGGDPLWERCGLRLGDLGPLGTTVVALPTSDTVSGNRGIALLDATTGRPYVELVGTGDDVPQVDNAVWEDEDSVVAVVTQGGRQGLVRIALDGTVERVGPLVRAQPMEIELFLGTRPRE